MLMLILDSTPDNTHRLMEYLSQAGISNGHKKLSLNEKLLENKTVKVAPRGVFLDYKGKAPPDSKLASLVLGQLPSVSLLMG